MWVYIQGLIQYRIYTTFMSNFIMTSIVILKQWVTNCDYLLKMTKHTYIYVNGTIAVEQTQFYL